MSPPEQADRPAPVLCKGCAANGRKRWLYDPLSIALENGPACARRALAANPNATAALALQLALDLGELPTRQPRRRRGHRELVAA